MNCDKVTQKFLVAELDVLQKRLRLEWPDSAEGVRKTVAQEVEASSEMLNLKKKAQLVCGCLLTTTTP